MKNVFFNKIDFLQKKRKKIFRRNYNSSIKNWSLQILPKIQSWLQNVCFPMENKINIFPTKSTNFLNNKKINTFAPHSYRCQGGFVNT